MAFIDIGYQTCIICGVSVEVTSVVNTNPCEHVDLDLRPKGPARHAEKNYVHLCPNCGYASFNLEKDITEGNHSLMEGEYQEIVNNQDLIPDAKKFYLVGLILEQLDEKQRASTAFLRASWFFGDANNQEWMMKSRKKVIPLMESSEFTWKTAQTCLILIDCYRRTGDFDSALATIEKFNQANLKDEYYSRLVDFQFILCNKKDVLGHNTRELDELKDNK